MNFPKKIIIPVFLFLAFTLAVPSALARDKEFDALVRHIQKSYQGKKVKIPFMWLARFAVKVVRPAGVKSFNFTLFENLKFSATTLDEEMQSAMRNSLNPEWIPLLRIRSRNGEQVYAYMREDGKNVKMMLVTIERNQAAVIRATFDPEKLAEFINDPKIFGISFGNGISRNKEENKEETKDATLKPKEETPKQIEN